MQSELPEGGGEGGGAQMPTPQRDTWWVVLFLVLK